MKEIEFNTRCLDGTHRGPSDFYKEIQEDILKEAAKGRSHAWQTPWMACKHEILSSKICHPGDGTVICHVSVSDDFDTPGRGEARSELPDEYRDSDFLELVGRLMDTAAEEAAGDLQENKVYEGYRIGKASGDDLKSWEYTYLVNLGEFDTPPGDNYYRWGWQEVEEGQEEDPDAFPEEIGESDAEVLAEGMQSQQDKVESGPWRAIKWE